jgi:hypothetical protein
VNLTSKKEKIELIPPLSWQFSTKDTGSMEKSRYLGQDFIIMTVTWTTKGKNNLWCSRLACWLGCYASYFGEQAHESVYSIVVSTTLGQRHAWRRDPELQVQFTHLLREWLHPKGSPKGEGVLGGLRHQLKAGHS